MASVPVAPPGFPDLRRGRPSWSRWRERSPLLVLFLTMLLEVRTPAQPGSQSWAFSTGEPVLASPALGPGGVVYVGSYDQHLYALDATTGALKWRFSVAPPKTNQVAYIYSSPAVAPDGTVYFGTDEASFSLGQSSGHLYAVNPDGTLKWRFALAASVYSDPSLGPDGTIYFGCYDSYLYALTPTGQQRWRFHAGGTIFSDAVVASDGTVYFGCDDHLLYALTPAGVLKWTFDTGGPVTAAPAIGTDGIVYLGTTSSLKFFAVNPDGTQRWEFTAGERIYSSAAIGPGGIIYFGSNDGYLYALNPDGTLRWHFAAGAEVRSSPAVAADGTIYVGAQDGTLRALDPDGNSLWTFSTGDYVYSSPAIGADGTVYVGSADRSLYAILGGSGLGDYTWPMLHRDIRHTGAVPPATNVPPTVLLTSPTSGMGFTAPASIALAAAAGDADGSVAKVEFFSGATSLGTVASAPYGFTWTSVPSGNYSLTAKATDDQGATTTSNPVSITVTNQATSVALLDPTLDGGVFRFSFAAQSGASYTVLWTASLNPTIGWNVLTNFMGDGTVVSVLDTNRIPPRFYQVSAQ